MSSGRKLNRCCRETKVVDVPGPGNFRRLLVRQDHHLHIYEAFFHIACLIITLRYL